MGQPSGNNHLLVYSTYIYYIYIILNNINKISNNRVSYMAEGCIAKGKHS